MQDAPLPASALPEALGRLMRGDRQHGLSKDTCRGGSRFGTNGIRRARNAPPCEQRRSLAQRSLGGDERTPCRNFSRSPRSCPFGNAPHPTLLPRRTPDVGQCRARKRADGRARGSAWRAQALSLPLATRGGGHRSPRGKAGGAFATPAERTGKELITCIFVHPIPRAAVARRSACLSITADAPSRATILRKNRKSPQTGKKAD